MYSVGALELSNCLLRDLGVCWNDAFRSIFHLNRWESVKVIQYFYGKMDSKARGRLYIHHNSTFFAISYGWVVISGNLSKSAFFEGWWITFGEYYFDMKGGITHQPMLVSENYRMIAVSCGIKISAMHHLVLSQYTRLTDGRTELRQQYRAFALHAVAR